MDLDELDKHPAIPAAIERWGRPEQWNMVQEECGELIMAITRRRCGVGGDQELAKEIADVLIVANQAVLMLERGTDAFLVHWDNLSYGSLVGGRYSMEELALEHCGRLTTYINHHRRGRISAEVLACAVAGVLVTVGHIRDSMNEQLMNDVMVKCLEDLQKAVDE